MAAVEELVVRWRACRGGGEEGEGALTSLCFSPMRGTNDNLKV